MVMSTLELLDDVYEDVAITKGARYRKERVKRRGMAGRDIKEGGALLLDEDDDDGLDRFTMSRTDISTECDTACNLDKTFSAMLLAASVTDRNPEDDENDAADDDTTN